MKLPQVLIVDDNEDIWRIYSQHLTAEGFGVFEARDIEAALERFRAKNLDVILLDIQMPAPDYSELIPALRRAHPHAKILGFSCYDVDFQRMTLKGADDFFSKTEGPGLLASKIRRALSTTGSDRKKTEDII